MVNEAVATYATKKREKITTDWLFHAELRSFDDRPVATGHRANIIKFPANRFHATDDLGRMFMLSVAAVENEW